IWKDILGVKEVSEDDNFFELGGHSLLAIQLISAVRKSFKVDLTLEDVFNEITYINLERKVYDLVSAVHKIN
ncbi:MAG TPA: phosphopantetheine-binding protein, partial [Ignavibacteriaceae bacterium]|nr:phosphopantetheine-binding protein [Ignavibacteriaceae bacterium]